MPDQDVHLIAASVRKWDLESNRLFLTTYQVYEEQEFSSVFEVTLGQPAEMLDGFLKQLREKAGEHLAGKSAEATVTFESEAFMRQKVTAWFKRINTELYNPKRKKGQPRMIFTTQLDIYPENQDISFLPPLIQTYVVLNWARRFYDKEDYKKAVDPLRRLIKQSPDFGPGYKMLARSLKKMRKYDEAMRNYEKYAEVDQSLDAWLNLAKSLRKGKVFDKSEEIYLRLQKEYPDEKEAKIGIAQIYYAQKQDNYLAMLDDLHKSDPAWLRHWLLDEFNFRIYVPEKTLLSPIQAAKFLGYGKVFELTEKAFKNEVPSHFNPARARVSFYQEELEHWATVMNRFSCLPEKVKLYPKKINSTGGIATRTTAVAVDEQTAAAPGKAPRKVDEILAHIRARKAERLAMQEEEEQHQQPAVNAMIPLNGTNGHHSDKKAKRHRKSPATKKSNAG